MNIKSQPKLPEENQYDEFFNSLILELNKEGECFLINEEKGNHSIDWKGLVLKQKGDILNVIKHRNAMAINLKSKEIKIFKKLESREILLLLKLNELLHRESSL